jgi:hypothetical protein
MDRMPSEDLVVPEDPVILSALRGEHPDPEPGVCVSERRTPVTISQTAVPLKLPFAIP